jgi:hypothetical protein
MWITDKAVALDYADLVEGAGRSFLSVLHV